MTVNKVDSSLKKIITIALTRRVITECAMEDYL